MSASRPLSPTSLVLGEDEGFTVPAQHPVRDALVLVPPKAEQELAELSRKRKSVAGTGMQYIEFLGLRLVLYPERGTIGWQVEVESAVPAAVEFWEQYKGIRKSDLLVKVDGREVAHMDGELLEKTLFRSVKGQRQLVFRRSAMNHLRWLREGPLCDPAQWEEQRAEPKVLSGLQRLAEELRAEEERRLVMEQQTALAQELAAKLIMTQEREREYVHAEAELYAAKNLRDEKEVRMEAMVEQMAWKMEEAALQRLAYEHEVQMAEAKAEADAWKRSKNKGLEEFLERSSEELESMEAEEQKMLRTRRSLEKKLKAKRLALDAE
ncbi:unnamed protein product, partial [Effrenium voratum]